MIFKRWNDICLCAQEDLFPAGAQSVCEPFAPLVFLVRRDGLTCRGLYAVTSLAEVYEEESVRCLTPLAASACDEALDAFVRANGASVLNTTFSAAFDVLQRYLQPGKTLVFLGSSGVGKSCLVNALAGTDIMAVLLFLVVQWQIFDQQWTGANDGHIAPEDVPQLRQLVQGGGAQRTAKLGQSDFIGQQVALFVPLIGHGAELIKAKNLLILTGTVLMEDHGTSQLGAHQNRCHQQHRGQHHQRQAGQQNVQSPLDVFFVE